MSKAGIAARGAAWTIASSFLSRGLGLLGTLVLIRFVSPSEYGEAAAAAVVVVTINQMTTLGVGVYLIANRNATREDTFHSTVIQCTLGLVALIALLVLARPLSPLFDTPTMYRYVPGLALSAFVDRFSFMPERILIRKLKFKRISIIRSMGELVYTGVSLATAVMGWGALAIVAGNLARAFSKTVAILSSVERAEWFTIVRLNFAVVKRIVGYGLTVTIGGLASVASRRWDNLLVSRFFGPAVMGTYNLAYNLADIPAVQIGEQISDVMQASFAQMEPEERRKTLLRSLSAIGLVTFPIAIGLGLVAPLLADLFLNKKWAGAGSMLLVLSALSVVRPVYGAMSSFILVERGPRSLVVLEWLCLGVLLALIATVGRLSPLWTCAAVGVAFTLKTLAGMIVARATSGTTLGAMLARLIPPLLACGPMAAAVMGVRIFLPRIGVHAPVALLIAAVSAGGACYIGAAFLFAPAPSRELVALVRRRRRGIPNAPKISSDVSPDASSNVSSNVSSDTSSGV